MEASIMFKRVLKGLSLATMLGGAITLAELGCGDDNSSEFDGGGGGGDGSSNDDGGQVFGGDGTPKPCVGLCLQQQSCPNGGTTSVSGTVYDPAGKVPLYNVVVYVPNAPLDPISSGATCDKCGTVSGNPLVSTLTDSSGNFKLTNVPVVKNLPLVLQVGKWRRAVTLPVDVPACTDTALTTPQLKDLTRLPKNHTEGNIPLTALTTGAADALECLLRKVGIEDSEFSTNAGTGRVHFYNGSGGSTKFDSAHGGTAFPAAQTFWSDAANLKKYDILLMACEAGTIEAEKPQAALDALGAYASVGGRVFASHWQRYWFWPYQSGNGSKTGNSAFDNFGTWQDINPDPPDPSTGFIDDTFPKGKAMKEWLASPGVAGSTVPGQISIKQPRANISSVDKTKAQQWITFPNPVEVEYLSFNTPQNVPDDQKCGRVVYSDLHVSGGLQSDGGPDPASDHPSLDWPQGCITTNLSAQEKALEFMLFDLASCIQSDQAIPQPPIK
jgi:hypothetical protein